MTRSILIIDDEPNMRWVLAQALEQAGYTVQGVGNGDAALSVINRSPIDLVLLDLKLKGEDGLSILRRLRERRPDLVVFMLTAYGTVANAVEAMQYGAADFLRKPFDVEEVRFKIERALERQAMQHEMARLTQTQRSAMAFETLIGCSLPWLHTVERARILAPTDMPVVLIGEAGTDRRALAHAMHTASTRHKGKIVAIDLRVFTAETQHTALWGRDGGGGAWAEAGSGSLVLLLEKATATTTQMLVGRLEQTSGRMDPRVFVLVTSEDELPPALSALLPARLVVPPLRERHGDVLLLARHLLGAATLTPQAAQLLQTYHWPGNIVELRGVLMGARQLASTGLIDVDQLPQSLHEAPLAAESVAIRLPQQGLNLEVVEQTLIRQALERARGNKSRAAELLGLTRHTLIYRMEKYGIIAPERV
jgi:DNA-binding NtrC family response regulator